jgi:hypothetical protein
MPLWKNNDSANSKPLLPLERQVFLVARLTTANATVSGANTITVTAPANTINTLGIVGSYIYSSDANNSIGRMYDGSIIDQTDIAFFRSNTTVSSVDTANSRIVISSITLGTLANGSTLYFANNLVFSSNVHSNTYADTILVTATRTTNANNTIANVGSLNTGWNHIWKKTNNDGTIRYIKETLVCLANATASNTTSGNTSFGQIVSGL